MPITTNAATSYGARDRLREREQRARAGLAATVPTNASPVDDAHLRLLERYVAGYEAHDVDRLTTLMREDARRSSTPRGSSRYRSAARVET